MAVVFVGCNGNDENSDSNKSVTASRDKLQIVFNNNLISLADKINYEKLEKSGFSVTDDYSGVLDESLEPSTEENQNAVSYNVKCSDGKLLAISAINLTKKTCKVKEGTVYFVACYSDDSYTREYTMPDNVQYGNTADEIKKAMGTPSDDFSNLETDKMLKYKVENVGEYVFNLDENTKLQGFSVQLATEFMFK
jgi:hypothetical protein